MSIIRRMRKQKAIWWKRGEPNRFGQFAFDAPIEVDCRWDDTAQQFLDPRGEMQVSRSIIYVDRVMTPGDRLKRGALESDTPSDPFELTSAYEVRRFDQNPNIRNTETLLTVYL